MSTADNASQEQTTTVAQDSPVISLTPTTDGRPVAVEPDLDFIRTLARQTGIGFKKCIQCGTCAGTCTLSPDVQAFPCKEMAWATWGMKNRLIEDLDVWLCHQCNDCSTRCPRGAQPGDVLAAVRQVCVQHFSLPRFLGRWANQPQGALLLLGIPAALLTAALLLKDRLATALGISTSLGERIVYAYSSAFPHWLLNGFFGLFSLLVLLMILIGVARFWHTMNMASERMGVPQPVKGLFPSIGAALKSIITHDKFAMCEKAHPRLWSHSFVFFGFLGLTAVTIWVITAPINPLITGKFIYPFGFFSPWKLLANLGGAAVLIGLAIMILERIKGSAEGLKTSYADAALLAVLLMVVLTGFITEVLHYVRLDPHRHVAYFAHLVFVFALLMYLPFSKLAHLIYRTAALVYAERFGRKIGQQAAAASAPVTVENKEEEYAPASVR